MADQRQLAAEARAELERARLLSSLAAVAREQAPLLQRWAELSHRHRAAAEGAVRAAELVAAHVPLANGAVADQRAPGARDLLAAHSRAPSPLILCCCVT